VRDHKHRLSLLRHRFQRPGNPPHVDAIKPRSRFIENDHVRILRERERDHETLLLTSRK